MISLHESLTSEIRNTYVADSKGMKIKTLLVCPGQINTSMFDGVKTPSSLLAPVLEPNDVARKIIEMISEGKEGTLFMPLYANFIPFLRGLPYKLTNFARRVSGVDRALENFNQTSIPEMTSTATTSQSPVTPIISPKGDEIPNETSRLMKISLAYGAVPEVSASNNTTTPRMFEMNASDEISYNTGVNLNSDQTANLV